MPALLLGALFVLLGGGAMLWLSMAVANDAGIRTALAWTPVQDDKQPSPIIAFLTQFGIVVPILVSGLGIAAIWLGIRLRTRSISAARWAYAALGWLTVGSLFAAFSIAVGPILSRFTQPTAPAPPAELLSLAMALVAAVLFWAARRWLNDNMDRVFFGREQLGQRESRVAWNLLIPTLIVFVLVAARPLEQTFIRSLTDKRFASPQVPNFVGLQNYQNLLGVRLDVTPCRIDDTTGACATRPDGTIRWESIDRDLLQEGYRTVRNIPLPGGEPAQSLAISGLDADFLRSIATTLLFAVVSVALELMLALFMALTVNSSFRGRGMMRAVMLIPWAIPTVISARLWELMLKDTGAGIINRVLMDMGVIDAPRAWLSSATLQLPVVIMVDVWKTAPFMALLLLAGLQSISKDLYEAASVDGASVVRRFWAITLPLLRPTIAVALVFRTLDALRVFDLFNVLFGRQQLSMATYNYEMLVNNQRDGYASAISIILFLLISIFAVIYVRMLNVETE
ncbi:MAG: sugar ABC transporter permease [Caldilinea sp.]